MNKSSVKKLGEGWTLDEVKAFVSAAYSRDAILDVSMGFARRALGPRAIAIIGSTTIHLLKVEDWPDIEALDIETMKSKRVTIPAQSSVHTADCQHGTATELGLMTLFEELGVVAPEILASFPIQIAGRTVSVLIGEQSGDEDECRALKSLVEHVGEQLEKVIKLAKNRELPPESQRIPPIPERFRRADPNEESFALQMPGPSQSEGEHSEGGVSTRLEGRQTQRIEYQVSEEPVFPGVQGVTDDEEFAFHAPSGAVAGASAIMFGLPLAKEPLVTYPPLSGVEITLPTSLEEPSNANNKTLMGGIAVQAEYLRPSAESSESEPAAEDVPSPLVRPVGSGTILGGVEAAVGPEPIATPAGAGILKTAPFVRRRHNTPPEISQVKDSPKTATRAMVHLQDDEPGVAEIGAERSNSIRVGMPEWSEAPKDQALIHDAWFDYFADERIAPSAKAENPSVPREDLPPVRIGSEIDQDPHTIPTEVLERLWDSGPIALDIQESLVELESRDQNVAYEAAKRVAQAGEQAIVVLAERFPGRLFVDRYQFTVETLPPVTEHGPVLSALVRLGDMSLPIVGRYLDSPSLDARFYATYLLSEISAESVLSKLMACLFDKDMQTRAVARTMMLNYTSSPQFKSDVLPFLRQKLEMAQKDLQVEVAAEILGRVRDVSAVPLLITELGKHTERVNKALTSSLQIITLQHHASPYDWRQWWANARNESRSLWLVKALDSPHQVIRFHALDEVQRTPGLDLAYHPDQPSKLRQRAQKLLEHWFEEHPQ